ncbi:unnamed protein product [Toxocara canis]|uniref:Uncharacterized protein n=1 Tax=Toxocara canis TaxID=6265 RepID=A0A183V2B7_TOXCA|nr:unnamed protein product [Toxocara canis]
MVPHTPSVLSVRADVTAEACTAKERSPAHSASTSVHFDILTPPMPQTHAKKLVHLPAPTLTNCKRTHSEALAGQSWSDLAKL